MKKRTLTSLLQATACVLLLGGCTKSNIVRQDEAASDGAPDFNMYMNIEIDEDQLHDDVNDVILGEDDYPMASQVDFALHLDQEYIDVEVVVKDGTSGADAAEYASDALKCINDQVAVQDFSYGESGDDTFGGLYQDNEVNLKIYQESEYPDGKPMYETTIPKDTYMTFDVED